MRLCIVQGVLPLYSISFFNRIVDLYPSIDLTVLADLKSSQALNQYQQDLCHFKVEQLKVVEIGGIIFRPCILHKLSLLNPEVVIFSGASRDLSQLWAMFVYRLTGRHFGAWGMFHRIGKSRLITNCYYRLVGFLANKCLTYTRIGATNLVRLGVAKYKVRIVGTAIDERVPFDQVGAHSPKDILEFKNKLGLDGKHIILQVVRLSKIKRPELLVKAAILLLKKRNDLLFVLVGDGEMKEELQRVIAENGLEGSFRLLGAIYDEAILSKWYMSAKVFVIPTFIGLSAHHAMSYGLPVVTDDSLDGQGSEFDILAEGLNSMAYQEGNIHDLARVLDVIISDEDLQYFLSCNARKTIEITHNLDAKTQRFVGYAKDLFSD